MSLTIKMHMEKFKLLHFVTQLKFPSDFGVNLATSKV